MAADRGDRLLAAVAAGPDPDPVRVRRDARLARRSAGRPARTPRLVAAARRGAGVLRDDLAVGPGTGAAGAHDRAPDRHPGRIAAALPRLVHRHGAAVA